MERSIVIGCGSIPSTEHRVVPSPQLALLVVSHQGDGYIALSHGHRKGSPENTRSSPMLGFLDAASGDFFTDSTMGMGFITIEG